MGVPTPWRVRYIVSNGIMDCVVVDGEPVYVRIKDQVVV